jgi:DNA-binding response OmpR family regulator
MKILVVDDEPDLLEQLRETLTSQMYDVDTADDGESAMDRLFDKLYDLIILDIMLPKVDGLTILREIRKAKVKTPVLMLTSKGTVEDKIKGLDYGADDYLAKPFATAELLARVRSLLRRTSDQRDPLLTVRNIALNTKTRQVIKSGKSLELTPKEFSILEFLLYNQNRVVSRYILAEHVWGDEFDPFTMSNFIDVHIKNLRRKIGDTDKKKIIRTVRGIGFIIEDEQK